MGLGALSLSSRVLWPLLRGALALLFLLRGSTCFFLGEIFRDLHSIFCSSFSSGVLNMKERAGDTSVRAQSTHVHWGLGRGEELLAGCDGSCEVVLV